MIIYDSNEKQLKLEIPLKGIEDVTLYQNALLRILGRINIESNDKELKEDLKTIYKLLAYTEMDQGSNAKIINSEK